ncbi:MAG TPA: hypothetical protein VFB99_08720, partial [Vicinamibacterales bacterium]|nr:hypothetical protein [Vicinamibacterales bacterium]
MFAPTGVLEVYFALTEPPAAELPPRYNLTPGQAVAVVREHDGRRRLDLTTRRTDARSPSPKPTGSRVSAGPTR